MHDQDRRLQFDSTRVPVARPVPRRGEHGAGLGSPLVAGGKEQPSGRAEFGWHAGDWAEGTLGKGLEEAAAVGVAGAGAPKKVFVSANSTIRPVYITATRSAMRSAAARSQVITSSGGRCRCDGVVRRRCGQPGRGRGRSWACRSAAGVRRRRERERWRRAGPGRRRVHADGGRGGWVGKAACSAAASAAGRTAVRPRVPVSVRTGWAGRLLRRRSWPHGAGRAAHRTAPPFPSRQFRTALPTRPLHQPTRARLKTCCLTGPKGPSGAQPWPAASGLSANACSTSTDPSSCNVPILKPPDC